MSTPAAVIPRFMLAPMAGITDAAMRSICTAHGAPLCHTEMVSAKGLLYDNRNTRRLLARLAGEQRYVVQIFGRDPAAMAEAAKRLEAEIGPALEGIDINMGCPAPKIFRRGEGAALMGEPRLAAQIIRACADAVSVPLSVKMRAGLRPSEVTAPAFARMAEEAGAARLTVHGRTASEMYRGLSSPDVIAAVKKAVNVPVIGNGDVRSAADAARLIDQTGCDGVMIGRAAIGNPFLFAELAAFFSGRPLPEPPTARERLTELLNQAALAAEDKGEPVAVRSMRAQMPRYLTGLHGAAQVRSKLMQAQTIAELRDILASYLGRLEQHGERESAGGRL
ncbi:MAG: tRNA dihydrouridine synthase DusB [Clostridia bacterium]|nr:tRNA dihydrouridine synthase DusB [Clostridia bacterium]